MDKKIDILFLDIDSVLNCSKFAQTVYERRINDKIFIEPNVPLMKKNVAQLQRILLALPNLKIIWCTDWRLYLDEMYDCWKNPRIWLENQYWMKDRIIGNTPKRFTNTHPQEIHLWFKQNIFDEKHKDKNQIKDKYYDVSSYAILDDWDDSLMHKFGSHLFLTNSKDGLTLEIADKLILDMKEGKCKYNKEELNWR